MPLLGAAALRVLIEKVVVPLPIISKIVGYIERETDGADALVIHIFSDGGELDTIVEKLLNKALPQLDAAFHSAGFMIPDLWRIAQSETKDINRTHIPLKAQLLYVRGEN